MTSLLTEVQITEAQAEMVDWRKGTPCRFLMDGRAVKLETGELASKGSNVMYHPVYWNFTRDTAKKVAEWTKTKVVFSE